MSITQRIKALDPTLKVNEIIILDGLKMVFETGDWLCIRLLGTENVARLYTEVIDIKRQGLLRHIGRSLLDKEYNKDSF